MRCDIFLQPSNENTFEFIQTQSYNGTTYCFCNQPLYSQIESHAVILYAAIGGSTTIGQWARVEGTPTLLNPNNPLAHVTNPPLVTHYTLSDYSIFGVVISLLAYAVYDLEYAYLFRFSASFRLVTFCE